MTLEVKDTGPSSRSRDEAQRRTSAKRRPRVLAGHEEIRAGEETAPGFYSILFATPEDRADEPANAPAFFADLNCDQIVDAITASKEEYNLKLFFYAPLRRVDAIEYRQEVMRDLEQKAVLERLNSFAQDMRRMRDHLGRAAKLHYKEQKQAWLLDAVEIYCQTITALAEGLSQSQINSRGFLRFRDYLASYVGSALFTALSREVQRLKSDLATVKYDILVKGDSFTVRRYEAEIDYSTDVENTFAKFREGAVEDYKAKFSTGHDMNFVEAKILEFVAKLYPQLFQALDEFCARRQAYLDEAIATFDREIQYYLAYLAYVNVLKRAGLPFCYPRITDQSKQVFDHDGFDIALAHKLVREQRTIICNDFDLNGSERILVISGPNQGGKTTFARTFGQLHYLASIGCPVPGREAQLFLFDQLFTHFEKEEKVENLRGKLEDDLIRIHGILDRATPRSIIVLNEIFTSTTLQDEIFLSTKVMQRIIDLDLLCVWVTFIDELASFAPQTVSMLSTVVPDNPAVRTFKIVRRPADGLAYAVAIAQKYRLTYDAIRKRLE
jgi:DNA mismatch repair protein MutS